MKQHLHLRTHASVRLAALLHVKTDCITHLKRLVGILFAGLIGAIFYLFVLRFFGLAFLLRPEEVLLLGFDFWPWLAFLLDLPLWFFRRPEETCLLSRVELLVRRFFFFTP